jgi:gliding motility-associated lipoprotein GldH
MRRKRNSLIFTAALLALLTLSCNRGTLFSGNHRMENERWSMYEPVDYACTVDDTASTFDIRFSLRTSTDYPYRNIYLFVVTTFPSGTTVTDTVHALLADGQGRWLGRGAGDLREMTIPFKSNVWFPEAGEYSFRVIHGMRDTILRGVYDFGMNITLREEQFK